MGLISELDFKEICFDFSWFQLDFNWFLHEVYEISFVANPSGQIQVPVSLDGRSLVHEAPPIYCSARTQGAMKTGPAPDESSVSVRSDNSYLMGWQPHQIWSYGPLKSTIFHGFGSLGWILACWPYLPNPTSYGHETCTIGYSKDWGLKGCVKWNMVDFTGWHCIIL